MICRRGISESAPGARGSHSPARSSWKSGMRMGKCTLPIMRSRRGYKSCKLKCVNLTKGIDSIRRTPSARPLQSHKQEKRGAKSSRAETDERAVPTGTFPRTGVPHAHYSMTACGPHDHPAPSDRETGGWAVSMNQGH